MSRAAMPPDSAGLSRLAADHAQSVSQDGRYVVFLSDATNVVAGQVDVNLGSDAFLFDRVLGTVTLASHNGGSPTTTFQYPVSNAAISPDGSYVAFTTGYYVVSQNILVYSRATGKVTGVPTINNNSNMLSFTADGRYLVFAEYATYRVVIFDCLAETLDVFGGGGSFPAYSARVSGDGRFAAYYGYDANLYLLEKQTGTTTLVSHVASDLATPTNTARTSFAVSADGAFVAFLDSGESLVAGQTDTVNTDDLFLFERATGANRLISRASGTATTAVGASELALSADGRYAAFTSVATNVSPGQVDANGGLDAFVYDRVSNTVTLASHAAGSPVTTGEWGVDYMTLSADGATLAFRSYAPNLVDGQSEPVAGYDAFLFARSSGAISLASHAVGLPTTATSGVNGPMAIAAEGGHVVFQSTAVNLVDGMVPANRPDEVFLYERASGLNRLVSRTGRPSATGNGESAMPPPIWGSFAGTQSISADGRFVAFFSKATNLLAGQVDTNGVADAFLYDRNSGQTVLLTRAAGSAVTTANSRSDVTFVEVSADGNYVIFACTGTNLVPGQDDANGGADLFLFERATGQVTLVSHALGLAATAAGLTSYNAAISADGGFVAFGTTLYVAPDYLSFAIFDRTTGTLTPYNTGTSAPYPYYLSISADGAYVTFDGTSALGWRVAVFERASGLTTDVGPGWAATVSEDGRYVAFVSDAVDVIPGQVDTPSTYDVFLRDRVGATTTLVSHALGSAVTAVGGDAPALSGDGRYVAFVSTSTGLSAGQNDANQAPDVFFYDRVGGAVTLVSHAAGSTVTAAEGSSYAPAVSTDGSIVAFLSGAPNLVVGQSDANSGNSLYDVLLYERATGVIALASRKAGTATTTGNRRSYEPVLSASGSHVAFRSEASDLVAEDFNEKTDVFVFGACSAPPVITQQPLSQTVAIGEQASFQVVALGAGGYRWQKDGIDIPGATSLFYTTPPVGAADSGTIYRCVVRGACASETVSQPATLTIADTQSPTAGVLSPAGGEYWLLSPSGGPPRQDVVSWSMSDDVRVCRASVSLRYSSDAGTTYQDAPAGGGLPATFGTGPGCAYPGATTTNLAYTVPTTFPSGTSGALYKVRLVVTDQAGNVTTTESQNPFYIVQANPDNVRTLILANVSRMQSRQAISAPQAAALTAKLLELASHPRVQGVVVDLGSVTALGPLYTAYDAAVAADDGSSVARANDVLFAANGIHDYLRSLLEVYTGARYVVLVGDDRIVPFARMPDGTVLLRESAYPAGGDIRAGATGVGQALAGNTYLSDDPLVVRDLVRPADLAGSVFVPDLAIGRLVETPTEITTAIATFIGQNGIMDVAALDPVTGHKALVTGYDFLTDGAKSVRAKWKGIFGASTPDGSLAPVDGSLVGGNWGLGTASERTSALRTRLSGNGGARYGIMSLAGHAAHYLEGVPGNDFTDIQGLSSSDIFGPDACSTPSLGPLNLAGSVIYAGGCHGGLAVPGSCRTDPDRSLDLPQTFLARGVTAYLANTGYGWGLKFGIGYAERLGELLTDELASASTVAVGDALLRTKRRYFLETPRYDPYDQKSLMQWTLYGLPMYSVKTGVAASSASGRPFAGPPPAPSAHRAFETRGGIGIERERPRAAQPPYLTQVNLSFDLTAPGLYEKKNSAGDVVGGVGCPDANGCFYTLNGLATGNTDLPTQPYFVYDSRLSGTSQHGVLWKGGTYAEETGWRPVFSELVSTVGGADGSNHGDAPRLIIIRPTAPRLVPGEDPQSCRSSDLEVNSVVVPAGEALKAQTADPEYTIERRYRTLDLEAFYFNNPTAAGQNCDREGPVIAAGPHAGRYELVSGRRISWSVPATDPSGVWRVVVVSNDNAVDATGRGTWVPLDLIFNAATGLWEGSRGDVSGSSTRVTYVVQAVDNRGNVTWIDYVSAALPASGASLSIPRPLDVAIAPGTTVTGFSPPSGPVGASILVTGTNFTGVTQVSFGGTLATTFNTVSATQLTATVPPGAVSGPIEVTAVLGKGTSAATFIVEAAPAIAGFAPDHGLAGTLVTVTGANFPGATSVTFNGTAAVFAVISPGEIEAAVPLGATTGRIGVTTPFGSVQSATDFTVTAPSGGAAFHTVSPCRVLDSRSDLPAVQAGATRMVTLAGKCGVPGTARAVSLNVTVTGPTEPGNLQVYPADQAPPAASALNYAAGQTRGNNAIIALSPSGALAVRCNQASGSAHVILDVNGYFE